MGFMETFVDDMSLDEAQEAAAREQQLRGGLADAQKALAGSGAKIDQMRGQGPGGAVPRGGAPPPPPPPPPPSLTETTPLPCPALPCGAVASSSSNSSACCCCARIAAGGPRRRASAVIID
eukprot:COSAG01_NODE_23_length_37704_cov_30.005877_29_plen_121_part_00